MKRIFINQPRISYYIGGAEMVSLDHAKYLYSNGYEVTILTIKPLTIGYNYSDRYLEFKNFYKGKISFLEFEFEPKYRYIFNIKPGENRNRWNFESIIYNKYLNKAFYNVDNAVMISYYILDAISIDSKIENCLYLCGRPKEVDIFQGSFLVAYDRIMAITKDVKKYWQQFTKQTIQILSTGVDSKRFCPCRNNKHTISNILYLGRVIKRKGIEDFLELSKESFKTKNCLNFTVVGDGPEIELYKNEYKKYVKFINPTSCPEEFYKKNDIVICPSKYGEGLQGVILEAMSSGCIVIATNTDINRELLHNERGFLIGRDFRELANCLEDICKLDSKHLNRIRENARKYVQKNYSWTNKIKDLMELIK